MNTRNWIATAHPSSLLPPQALRAGPVGGDPEKPDGPPQPIEPGEPTRPDQPPPVPVA